MSLVRTCLEKSPERRFQSARDLALILASELADSSSSQARRARAAAPRLLTLGGAAALLLLGSMLGLGISWISRTEQPAASRDLPARFAISLPGKLPFSYGSPVAISPDGTQVAVAMAATDGGHQLFLRRIDRDELVPLLGTQGAQFPFFSPDGEWVGFWSENKIRKVSIRGGTAIAVADSREAPLRGADWGDGVMLLAPQALGPLAQIAMDTGEVRPATTLDASRHEYSHRWPQVLPGGRGWLYTAVSGTPPTDGVPSAMLHIPATGETRELVAGAMLRPLPG